MPRLTTRRLTPLVAGTVGAGLLALAGAAVKPHESAPTSSALEVEGLGLPASVRPAFVPGRRSPPPTIRHSSKWAPVRGHVVARRAPRPGGPAITVIAPTTPEGTANIVSVIERREVTGRTWVRVGLSVLPNGTTGWVPRAALGGYGTVTTRLDIDLRRFRATLYRAGKVVFRAVVGVGRRQSPTPQGTFYIRDKLTRYRSRAYGPIAFGTNARSPTLTDWPAGGFVGIHGTHRPDVLPGRVSHGCIRLRNRDIVALARRMPVGTPVTIH